MAGRYGVGYVVGYVVGYGGVPGPGGGGRVQGGTGGEARRGGL